MDDRNILPTSNIGPTLKTDGGLCADVGDINFVQPVDPDIVADRKPVAFHFLGGNNVPTGQKPSNHIVWLVTTHFGPDAGLIAAGQRNRVKLKFKTFFLSQSFQDFDWFLTKRIIQISKANLDTRQVAAALFLDIGDVVGGLAPISRTNRKDLREHGPIGSIAPTNQRLDQNILVLHDPRQNSDGNRCRQHVEHEHTFALEFFIALNSALRFVAVILNDDFNVVTTDAALHID